MTLAFATAAVALLVSLAVTPIARWLALAIGMADAPGGRRIHTRLIPRGGGVAVAVASVVACVVCVGQPAGLTVFALAGAVILLAVGLADDLMSMRPHTKLLGQLVAAILAVVGGLRLSLIDPAGAFGAFAIFDPVLTVVWVVLITNAVNLSDGLDGLAAGVGVIACSWLAFAALAGADPSAAIAPLALAGALLGFLVYNSNPASVFLGDAGSLVIGYAMAVLPLVQNGGNGMPLPAAALLVAFPVTDTMLAIGRRFVSRCVSVWGDGLFWRGIVEGLRNTVSPDRNHIHHRLLDLGFSQRRAVLLIYLASATTGALSYVTAQSPGWPVDLFAVGLGVGVIVIVQALGIGELQIVRSGLFLPLIRRLATQRWLLVTTDACLVIAVYGGVLLLAGGRATSQETAIGVVCALVVMAALQVVAFSALGVYRTAWRATGVGGFGLLIRACAVGTVSGYVALRVTGLPTGGAVALVHFLLFLSAVNLVRFSYVVLVHGALRAAPAEPTLVCGTGAGARYALARVRAMGPLSLQPVGFVELKPRWQGRHLDQLPVLGTLDALGAIIREQQAKHLVIADSELRDETLAWVRAVCRQSGVKVHRYVERFVAHDELAEQLRGAEDVASAWAVLGNVFRKIGLDGCVLSLGNGEFDGTGDNQEIYTWRRVPDANSKDSGALTADLSERSKAEAQQGALVNGNGNGHGRANGRGHVNGNGVKKEQTPRVLRLEGGRWCRATSTASSSEDVLALPVRSGDAVWGVLLATPRAGDRLITSEERAQLRRAAEVLGQRVAEWNAQSRDRSQILGSSTLRVRTA